MNNVKLTLININMFVHETNNWLFLFELEQYVEHVFYKLN